jgi:hypothetical protein
VAAAAPARPTPTSASAIAAVRTAVARDALALRGA